VAHRDSTPPAAPRRGWSRVVPGQGDQGAAFGQTQVVASHDSFSPCRLVRRRLVRQPVVSTLR
jgi:hypothetical protein